MQIGTFQATASAHDREAFLRAFMQATSQSKQPSTQNITGGSLRGSEESKSPVVVIKNSEQFCESIHRQPQI
jgi:hypothetical protein